MADFTEEEIALLRNCSTVGAIPVLVLSDDRIAVLERFARLGLVRMDGVGQMRTFTVLAGGKRVAFRGTTSGVAIGSQRALEGTLVSHESYGYCLQQRPDPSRNDPGLRSMDEVLQWAIGQRVRVTVEEIPDEGGSSGPSPAATSR